MIDLETMDTRPTAAILSIGGVYFDPVKGLGDEFYLKVNLDSSVAAGLTVSEATQRWWEAQSAEARAVFDDPRVELALALSQFTRFITEAEDPDVCIWGNGASFDNAILSNAYKALDVPQPWAFWNDRCFRTLKALRPHVALPEREGTHHNALDDAKHQARCAIALFNQGELEI